MLPLTATGEPLTAVWLPFTAKGLSRRGKSGIIKGDFYAEERRKDMQEEIMNQLLVELFGMWGGGAKVAAKKLKTESVTKETIIAGECSFQEMISQVKS